QVAAALLVFGDAEGVDLAFVRGRVGPAHRVDLRERAERALARDTHLVAALHGLVDAAFDRQAAVIRVLELRPCRGAPGQLSRQRQPAAGRHDDRLEAVADGDLDVP